MSLSLDLFTKKIILNKLRLRCSFCYSGYSDDAYIGVVEKFFTHKTFFIYNKKQKKNQLYTNNTLIASERSCVNNNNQTIYSAFRFKKAIPTASNYGKVVQIELICSKCYGTRYCEINLEKFTGQNHWV